MARRYDAAYCQTVARSVGVPDMWIEDASQSMLLAQWRRPTNFNPRSAAIDFVRQVGSYSRYDGQSREYGYLPEGYTGSVPDFSPVLCDLLDAGRFLAVLPERERAAILRYVRGENTNVRWEQMKRAEGRRRLQELAK